MNNSSNSNFVETVEHRRFAEFCDACGHYHYIGLCYGPSGVGKTLSARRYSRWDYLEKIDWYAVPNEVLESLTGIKAIFYITPVVNTPGRISSDIDLLRSQLHTRNRAATAGSSPGNSIRLTFGMLLGAV